ncbi:MAG: GTP pyrophosphokinase family protein [Clostridia bacterium]|nr:GTP pyrophosphokinase family protein [Clostridia bacterium]
MEEIEITAEKEAEAFLLRLRADMDDQRMSLLQQKAKEIMVLMSLYKCAMLEIETKFKVLNEEYSLAYDRNPISSIKTRLKTFPSIREKMERRGLPATVESLEKNIHDVAGVRVICSFPEDVYMLADALLRQDDITLIEKKDYIKSPKENGYRSLHMIVAIPIFLAREKRMMKVEIQLRTIAMDFWASLEHQLRYKKDITFTEEMAKELKDCAEESAALDLRMDELRKNVLCMGYCLKGEEK